MEPTPTVEDPPTTTSPLLTDSDLASTMEGVDTPSQPNGIYASQHAPGNQIYKVSDDEVEMPLATPMVVVEPLSSSAGILRTIGNKIFSRLLTSRLASVLPDLFAHNQAGVTRPDGSGDRLVM